jgi:hypothetical protein
MGVVGRFLAIALFSLGSFNHLLLLSAETCTGGSADSLAGIIVSGPLYLLACLLFVLMPLLYGWLLLLPALALFSYCAYWSLRLAIGRFGVQSDLGRHVLT